MKPRTVQAIALGGFLYFCLVSISYGLSWIRLTEQFRESYRATGNTVEGKLEGYRTAGWGAHKTYYLRVRDYEKEIVVPALLINGASNPEAGTWIDLGKRLRPGSPVRVLVTVGMPLGVQILQRTEGDWNEILTHGQTIGLSRILLNTGEGIGLLYLFLGISLALGLVTGLTVSKIVTKRIDPKPRQA